MKPLTGIFLFESFDADAVRGVMHFRYRVRQDNEEVAFEETLSFSPLPNAATFSENVFQKIAKSLFLLSGISYWKLWCPPTIEVGSLSLTAEEAAFWNTLYTKGLGEFFYQSQIDFRGLVNFPTTATTVPPAESLVRQDRSLVLVGGGKDSIVSASLMREHNKPFSFFTLNEAPVQTAVMNISGGERLTMTRTLDAKLFALNKQPGTLNGHVPISAFYGFTALLAAVLYDYRFIVASNERSADEGNVEYLGSVINHQWCKSIEFEELLQNYIRTFITPDISYFSLLRPWSELQIAERFAKEEKYFETFTSCNRNFALLGERPTARWCGECPKCAFVFATLASFLLKETMLKIFGKNLFAEASLVPTYRELLGLVNTKPFECVGTPEETALAFLLAEVRGEYQTDVAMTMFQTEAKEKFLPLETLKGRVLSPSPKHHQPKEFQKILREN